jgi:hypothetical protein
MPQPRQTTKPTLTPKRPPLLVIITVPVALAAVLVVVALASRNPQSVGLASPSPTAKSATTPDSATPTPVAAASTATPRPAPAAPAAFTVSAITIHNPQIVTNTDKVGGSNRACQVTADITATAAGTVYYYWDSYHKEYYNPSLKGLDESVTFAAAGTKTVTLPTYVSNDNRRFTLFVTSPGNLSRATATQVWCPAS